MKMQNTRFLKLASSAVAIWLTVTTIMPYSIISKIPLAKAMSITVDTTSDAIDAGACGTVVFADLPGVGGVISLGEAICVANNEPGADSILFGAGISNSPINITTELPAIMNDTSIIGDNDTLINGGGTVGNGLTFSGNSSSITGVKIYGFTNQVITVSGMNNLIGQPGLTNRVYVYGNATTLIFIGNTAGGTTIKNTYVGMDAALTPNGATGYGIDVRASNATLGGNGADESIVVTDNTTGNINIGDNASGVKIRQAYIGVDPSGTSAAGASAIGINLNNASNTTIGRFDVGDKGNVIGGHSDAGIKIQNATNTLVAGNKIGSDDAGFAAIPNSKGIVVDTGSSVTNIGGAPIHQQNVVSGNTNEGIKLINGSDTTIQNNLIGVNKDGTGAIANNIGIGFSGALSNTKIGGPNAGEGNVISGNTNAGIDLTGGATIHGNVIGLNSSASSPIPNNKGIIVRPTSATIVIGNNAGSGKNIISGNTTNGIETDPTFAGDIKISGNYIGTDGAGYADLGNGASGIKINQTGGGAVVTIGEAASGVATNVIAGNAMAGIYTAGSCNIYSSHIGTNIDGTGAITNNGVGIKVENTGNVTIGNNSLTTGYNVISGNTATGVFVNGTNAAVTISGNIVGLNAAGNLKMQNGGAGIDIKNALSSSVTIGDIASAEPTNVVSGNTTQGILINNSPSTKVYSTFIGTDKLGGTTAGLGNTLQGINVNASTNVTIGSTRTSGQNLVANNLDRGLLIGSGSNNAIIKGNIFSTDVSFTANMGNGSDDIDIESGVADTVIGDIGVGEGNIFRYSKVSAVNATDSNILVRGNEMYNAGAGPIVISAPGAWDIAGAVTFTAATTGVVSGTVAGFADGTTVDVYSGTNAVFADMSKYEGATVLSGGAFELNKDFQAVAGEYYYVILTNLSSKNSTVASQASMQISADVTPPADVTVTSLTGTNNAAYTMTGTKEAHTNILNDNLVIVPYDGVTTWSAPFVLIEGSNTFNLVSKDYSENKSGTSTVSVLLDTVVPVAPTASAAAIASGSTAPITVYGEIGTSIYVNGVDSSIDIGVGGSGVVTASVPANISTTYNIKLVEGGVNSSGVVAVSIQGITTGGGGGGGGGGSTPPPPPTTGDTTPPPPTTGDTTPPPPTTGDTTPPPPGEITPPPGDALAGENEVGTPDYTVKPIEPKPTTDGAPIQDITPVQDTTQQPTGKLKPPLAIQNNVIVDKTGDITTITNDKEGTKEVIDTTEGKAQLTYKDPGTGQLKTVEINTAIPTETVTKQAPSDIFTGGIVPDGQNTADQKEAVKQYTKAAEKIAEKNDIKADVQKIVEQIVSDDDGDGMPTWWEEKNLGDEEMKADDDTDQDGITNAEEYRQGTDPLNSDTDGDGLSDLMEIAIGSDSVSWDTDGDGVSDYDEAINQKDPSKRDAPEVVDVETYKPSADTDGDGISDYKEAQNGTDPNASDTDGDGISDADEWAYGTNPNQVDQAEDLTKASITNLSKDEVLSSGNSIIRGTGEPNTTVVVTIANADGEPVGLYEAEVDQNGQYAVPMNADLDNGEYAIFAAIVNEDGNTKDVSKAMDVTVDKSVEVDKATVDTENVTDNKFIGTTNPGSTIYATWKSMTFSSVLVADLNTGEYVAEIPRELVDNDPGDHSVYFYPVDEETGIKGEVVMANFTVTGDGFADATQATNAAGTSDSLPYMQIILLLVLGLAGTYIAIMRARRQHDEESKLINKLKRK